MPFPLVLYSNRRLALSEDSLQAFILAPSFNIRCAVEDDMLLIAILDHPDAGLGLGWIFVVGVLHVCAYVRSCEAAASILRGHVELSSCHKWIASA